MECHKCQHRKAVEAGKYARTPFAKTPCGKCALVEDSGRTLAYDEGREKVEARSPREVAEGEEFLPSSVVQEIVAVLLTMPRVVRDAVCWRYAGFKFRDISAVQGVTMAGAEIRVKRALRRWPVLKALFPEKVAKQGRRRKPQGSKQ